MRPFFYIFALVFPLVIFAIYIDLDNIHAGWMAKLKDFNWLGTVKRGNSLDAIRSHLRANYGKGEKSLDDLLSHLWIALGVDAPFE